MLRRELAREIPIQKSKYPSPKKNNFIIFISYMRLCWLTGLSPCLLISIGGVSNDKGEVLRSTLINP